MSVEQPTTVPLTGSYTNWVLFDFERKHGTVQNLPYKEAVECIMPKLFNGMTGNGQQRPLFDAHVRKIKKEMETGNFTPTNAAASLDKRHRAKLVLNPDMTFTLPVNTNDPLLLTDSNHRYEALHRIVIGLREAVKKEKDEAEKAKLARWLEQAENLPITVTVYFDGEPSRDFVNLQAGRPVDASHIQSLSLQAGLVKDPIAKSAHALAKKLHETVGSPFHEKVKFDARGLNPLPISTLTAKGSSDLATSLLGLARVGAAFKKDAKFLVSAVTTAFGALKEADPKGEGLLDEGKLLTPLAFGGTKGSSTMLVGVGVCLAYRLAALGKEEADATDLAKLVDAADEALDEKVNGNLSGQAKRAHLGKFAKEFLSDLPESVAKHHGLPVDLLKALSCSAFAVAPLPKEKKPKAKKAAPKKPKSVLPDVDGPVTVTNKPVVAAPGTAVTPTSVSEQGAPWEQAASEPKSGDAGWKPQDEVQA